MGQKEEILKKIGQKGEKKEICFRKFNRVNMKFST